MGLYYDFTVNASTSRVSGYGEDGATVSCPGLVGSEDFPESTRFERGLEQTSLVAVGCEETCPEIGNVLTYSDCKKGPYLKDVENEYFQSHP